MDFHGSLLALLEPSGRGIPTSPTRSVGQQQQHQPRQGHAGRVEVRAGRPAAAGAEGALGAGAEDPGLLHNSADFLRFLQKRRSDSNSSLNSDFERFSDISTFLFYDVF